MYSRKTIEDNIVLLALAGSRAYGTSTKDYDYDWRGIMIRPSIEDYLRYEGFEQKDSGWLDEQGELDYLSEDTVVWDLQKYLKLANKANPNILEQLWHEGYRILEPVRRQLIKDRDLFINQNIKGSYRGYASSQLRRLQNVSGTQVLTRANDRKAGYKCKHVMHCLRLLYQLHYLLTKGRLIVDIRQFSNKRYFLLKNIKNGDVELSYVQQTAEDLMVMLNEADYSEIPKPMTQQQLSQYFITLLRTYYET